MRVLFVSKPICPPLHDGSQCLVRDVATRLRTATPVVMGVRDAPHPFAPAAGHVDVAPVYSRPGTFAPSLVQNGQAFLHLLRDSKSDLWHFVFAPNPRTSFALTHLRKLKRTPAVQTIASPPRDFARARELVFGDRLVVQSQWTKRQLLEHAPELDIRVIPTAAPRIEAPTEAAIHEVRTELGIGEGAEVVVYPGDLEFSQGSHRFAEVIEALAPARNDTIFVYACRSKTARAEGVAEALKQRLSSHGVRFAGELDSLLPLLAVASVVVFPTDSAFGKVDIPIALLEAMRLGVPVISFDFGPLMELGGSVKVPLGDTRALMDAVCSLLDDASQRQEVSRAQHAFLADHLDPQDAALKYEQLYREMLE